LRYSLCGEVTSRHCHRDDSFDIALDVVRRLVLEAVGLDVEVVKPEGVLLPRLLVDHPARQDVAREEVARFVKFDEQLGNRVGLGGLEASLGEQVVDLVDGEAVGSAEVEDAADARLDVEKGVHRFGDIERLHNRLSCVRSHSTRARRTCTGERWADRSGRAQLIRGMCRKLPSQP
jgi:hypothetical protein